ncbi:MAG: IscS subfamily cysteine desulfurase [Pseudomonadales bacterium]|nr:IscS subfamily cysteine desulfurase [Pseudomonadales bacterium]
MSESFSFPIYLDYAATTPVDPRVVEKMVQCLGREGVFANPASRSHMLGWQAEHKVETARREIADLLQCDPREIVFTSGATESDNLAIKGVAEGEQHRLDEGGEPRRHIITSQIEHKAVLDTCAYLSTSGFEVTYLKPNTEGLITFEQVAAAIRVDTLLVSLMHVNNELGTVLDIASIGELTRERGVFFHVDAAQSAGKVEINLMEMKVDLMSFSAHKLYGPKGMGALFVRRQPKVPVVAQIHGGGHERGMRSGTLATHQIVGMGAAFNIAKTDMAEEVPRIEGLRIRLWEGLQTMAGVNLNGDAQQRVAGILNVSFSGVDGEALLKSLKDIAVSTGSACTSVSVEPSYVLKAIGVTDALAHGSIRFSIGRFTTKAEIDYVIEHVCQAVIRLRG